jgi:hypothetical protein
VPTALARSRDPALRRPAARPEGGGFIKTNRQSCEEIAVSGERRPSGDSSGSRARPARRSVGGRPRMRLFCRIFPRPDALESRNGTWRDGCGRPLVFLRSVSQGQLRCCPGNRDNMLLSCPQSDHDLRGDSTTEYQQSCSKLAESGSIILTTHISSARRASPSAAFTASTRGATPWAPWAPSPGGAIHSLLSRTTSDGNRDGDSIGGGRDGNRDGDSIGGGRG